MMEKTLIGYCGVDSGQLMLIDPCYVDEGFDYNEIIELWSKAKGKAGIRVLDELGVVTNTGWGDGNYPVYAEMIGNRVARVTVEFMSEDDDA